MNPVLIRKKKIELRRFSVNLDHLIEEMKSYPEKSDEWFEILADIGQANFKIKILKKRIKELEQQTF